MRLISLPTWVLPFATNAICLRTDIAKLQEWQGHANMQSAEVYDRPHGRDMSATTSANRVIHWEGASPVNVSEYAMSPSA